MKYLTITVPCFNSERYACSYWDRNLAFLQDNRIK